jgi:hypothetical protein
LHREQDHQGVESEPPGGESEDRSLAIAFGGFSRQMFSAFLERCFKGPTWWVTLPHLLRRHLIAVVKTYSSRWGPVQSWPYTQRTATRSSPIRYQGPVPVTTSRSRVLPPYHATVRRVRVAVCATTAGGEARGWPFTRGRPIVWRVRGGGGSYHAASPETLRTTVREERGVWPHRAVALVP